MCAVRTQPGAGWLVGSRQLHVQVEGRAGHGSLGLGSSRWRQEDLCRLCTQDVGQVCCRHCGAAVSKHCPPLASSSCGCQCCCCCCWHTAGHAASGAARQLYNGTPTPHQSDKRQPGARGDECQGEQPATAEQPALGLILLAGPQDVRPAQRISRQRPAWPPTPHSSANS